MHALLEIIQVLTPMCLRATLDGTLAVARVGLISASPLSNGPLTTAVQL